MTEVDAVTNTLLKISFTNDTVPVQKTATCFSVDLVTVTALEQSAKMAIADAKDRLTAVVTETAICLATGALMETTLLETTFKFLLIKMPIETYER